MKYRDNVVILNGIKLNEILKVLNEKLK